MSGKHGVITYLNQRYVYIGEYTTDKKAQRVESVYLSKALDKPPMTYDQIESEYQNYLLTENTEQNEVQEIKKKK